jgi:hypothetical protein
LIVDVAKICRSMSTSDVLETYDIMVL